MLIEVHYGNGSILLVNGNCRVIHILDYLRHRCCLSSSIKFDLCLITNGEPLHISSMDSKSIYSDQHRSSSYVRCVLTKIDEDGKYIPLLNDSTLITNEFLAKLKRATSSSKENSKSMKQSNRSRSLRSLAIAASLYQQI